ncbi:hypothetical protein ROZALSC1DRAFT_25986, partial [Rozella allomycis CSF55]
MKNFLIFFVIISTVPWSPLRWLKQKFLRRVDSVVLVDPKSRFTEGISIIERITIFEDPHTGDPIEFVERFTHEENDPEIDHVSNFFQEVNIIERITVYEDPVTGESVGLVEVFDEGTAYDASESEYKKSIPHISHELKDVSKRKSKKSRKNKEHDKWISKGNVYFGCENEHSPVSKSDHDKHDDFSDKSYHYWSYNRGPEAKKVEERFRHNWQR